MRVNTNIRRMDLVHFNLVLLPRLRSTYTTIGVLAFLIFVLLYWQNGAPDSAREWTVLVIASLGGGVGGMVAGLIISMLFILTTSSKSNGILGEHEYEITPQGLLEKTNANEGLSKWSGIQDIRKVGPFLLFRISGYLFHVIPRRSFVSEEAFQDFFENAKRKWQGAA